MLAKLRKDKDEQLFYANEITWRYLRFILFLVFGIIFLTIGVYLQGTGRSFTALYFFTLCTITLIAGFWALLDMSSSTELLNEARKEEEAPQPVPDTSSPTET